jgi:hypothetical protein
LFTLYNKLRPLSDEETDNMVFGQIRTTPPRASFNTAGRAPAETCEPLITCVPPLAN